MSTVPGVNNVPGVSTATDPARSDGPSATGASAATRPSGRSRGVGGLVVWVVLTLLLAAAAGLVWARLADPAEWVVTDDGRLLLSEQASTAQVAVELLYCGLGVAVSFVAAALGTWRLRSRGWVVVPVAGVTALVGALIAWRVGILAGPAGTDDVSGTVRPGDTVQAALAVESWGSFVLWPVAALLAVVLVVWLTDRPRHDDDAETVNASGEPAPRP